MKISCNVTTVYSTNNTVNSQWTVLDFAIPKGKSALGQSHLKQDQNGTNSQQN